MTFPERKRIVDRIARRIEMESSEMTRNDFIEVLRLLIPELEHMFRNQQAMARNAERLFPSR